MVTFTRPMIDCDAEAMELRDAIRARRMIRSYQPDRPVPREVLDELLDLAVRAPSAGYSQGWRFLILADITSVEKFWTATSDGEPNSWLQRLQTAPALIVCFSDKTAYLDRYAEPDKGWTDRAESHWPVPYWDVDTGMAALLMLLGATDRGLGACFFGVPGERWDALRESFAVPPGLRPVGVISLGYPAPDVRSPSLRRGRRSYSDVVSYGSFDASSDAGA
jgi:nitroreductase